MTIPAFNLSYGNIIIMNIDKSSLNYNKVTTYGINISPISTSSLVCTDSLIRSIQLGFFFTSIFIDGFSDATIQQHLTTTWALYDI